MNNNLCIIRGGYSHCLCTSGESQIPPAVLRMNIHKNLASLTVSLGFPHWLGNSPRYSHTFHNCSHSAPIPVIRDPSYSEGQPECPPRVLYSREIDASKFTLHILSDTPGGSQRLKYILLMCNSMAQRIGVWILKQYVQEEVQPDNISSWTIVDARMTINQQVERSSVVKKWSTGDQQSRSWQPSLWPVPIAISIEQAPWDWARYSISQASLPLWLFYQCFLTRGHISPASWTVFTAE